MGSTRMPQRLALAQRVHDVARGRWPIVRLPGFRALRRLPGFEEMRAAVD